MKRVLKSTLSIVLALTIILSSAAAGLGQVDFGKVRAFVNAIVPVISVKAEAASSGACGDNLTWTLDNKGTLTISGTGAMTNYSSSEVPWYSSSSNIKMIVIYDGVTSICDYAFSGCDNLASITIPDSVTSIGWNAFFLCNNLKSITVDAANKNYCSIGGVLFNKNKTTLIQYPIGKASTSYRIPDSVTSIGGYAFCRCISLTSVTIPNSVTSIGWNAFDWCTSLTSIIIPDSVTSIGGHAFRNCTSLTSVTISKCVTSIGEFAFYYCKSLTSITIPDSVTSIGDYAFGCCNSLASITIPNSVTSIGDSAFYGCTKLSDVYYLGNNAQRNKITIGESNNSLLNAVWHYIDTFSFSNYLFNYYTTVDDGFYENFLSLYNKPSGSEMMVYSAQDTYLEESIDAWYAIKSIANPGNSLDSLNYQQQYEMIIYGVLFDVLCDEEFSKLTYSNAVTDVSKFTSDVVDKWNLADVLDKTNLTGAESEELKKAALDYIGNSGTKWTALGDYTALIGKVSGTVDKVVKTGVGVHNIIQKICMLSQLINLGDEAISYLYMLKSYSTDPLMKLAVQEVIDSVSKDWVGIAEKTVLDVGFEFNKTAVSIIVDMAWANVCAVNPFLAGMSIGDVAGTFVCNVFLATEDIIEQYSNMKKIVEIKNATKSVHYRIESVCKNNVNTSNTKIWTFSLSFMNSLITTDFESSIEFARIAYEEGLVNTIINLFSSSQTQSYNEYKKSAESLISIHNINYCLIFSNPSLNFELCKTHPQYYSACFPTSIGDFNYKINNGKITITGLSGWHYDVVIPDEIDGLPVTSLSYDALEHNPDVEIVVLGKNVTDISGLTSSYAKDLAYVYADTDNAKYCSIDGVLFSKDKKTIHRYTYGLNDGTYNIPNTVTTIGEFAFAWSSAIESILLPNSITSIGGSAFKGCTNLKKLELPSKITSIPGAMCIGCTNLESVTIPDGVVNIGGYAFNGCENLKTIRIPISLKVVGALAFDGCNSLEGVEYSGSTTQWNNIEIQAGNEPLCNAYSIKPATPVTKAANTLTGINVTWNAVEGAVKYVVYKRLGTSSTWDIIATTTDTSFADNNAPAYGSYYVYSVKAYNASNIPSDYVKANTATVQRVVAPYTKASNALDGISVTWGKVAGANKYVVLRRIGTESTWKIIGETTGTSVVDKNVRAGVYYLYSIRAVNNTGYSAYDVNKRFTIQRVVAPYTKAANAVNGINVTWGKVAGASKYVVLRRIGTESTWKIIGETTGTSFLDKNVTPGIYYIYSIRAVNGTGYSAYDINKRITIQYITAPTARAVNKSSGVQVSWNKVTGATKYNVYRRLGGTSTWVYVGTTTSTTLLDRNVVDGKYYVYSIRAINGTGYSAYNSSKCATIKHI